MPANIISLFERVNITPKKKTGTEWCSPCPACGGDDRCSIWPEDHEGRGYYWCRRCEAQGDGIQFLRDFCKMTYAEACKEIGVVVATKVTPPRLSAGANRHKELEPAPKKEAKSIEPTQGRTLWKTKATAFATWAHKNLLESPKALAWLEKRGLSLDAVKRYGLGWNVGEGKKSGLVRPRESWGLTPEVKKDGKPKKLWIPRGLVIPQLVKEDEQIMVHRLRIRRTEEDRKQFNPKQKYFVVPGSEMDMLFLPCHTLATLPVVVVVESELDALLLHHLAGDFVSVLASMTSSVTKIPKEIFKTLQQASSILVALDFDEEGKDGKRAGTEAWPRWNATFAHATRWPVPAGKDPGEAFEQGENLRLWLWAGIPEGLRFAMTTRQTSARQEKKEQPTPQGEEIHRVEQREKNSNIEKCLRWQRGNKPLEEVTLPKDCYWGLNGLRLEFSGKEVNDDLLLPCPKTKPIAWRMVQKKQCSTCLGHENCLLDFILSPEIMVPEDKFYVLY